MDFSMTCLASAFYVYLLCFVSATFSDATTSNPPLPTTEIIATTNAMTANQTTLLLLTDATTDQEIATSIDNTRTAHSTTIDPTRRQFTTGDIATTAPQTRPFTTGDISVTEQTTSPFATTEATRRETNTTLEVITDLKTNEELLRTDITDHETELVEDDSKTTNSLSTSQTDVFQTYDSDLTLSLTTDASETTNLWKISNTDDITSLLATEILSTEPPDIYTTDEIEFDYDMVTSIYTTGIITDTTSFTDVAKTAHSIDEITTSDIATDFDEFTSIYTTMSDETTFFADVTNVETTDEFTSIFTTETPSADVDKSTIVEEFTEIYTTGVLETTSSYDVERTTAPDVKTLVYTNSLTDVHETMDEVTATPIFMTDIVTFPYSEATTGSEKGTDLLENTPLTYGTEEATEVITVDATDEIAVTLSTVFSEFGGTLKLTTPAPVVQTNNSLANIDITTTRPTTPGVEISAAATEAEAVENDIVTVTEIITDIQTTMDEHVSDVEETELITSARPGSSNVSSVVTSSPETNLTQNDVNTLITSSPDPILTTDDLGLTTRTEIITETESVDITPVNQDLTTSSKMELTTEQMGVTTGHTDSTMEITSVAAIESTDEVVTTQQTTVVPEITTAKTYTTTEGFDMTTKLLTSVPAEFTTLHDSTTAVAVKTTPVLTTASVAITSQSDLIPVITTRTTSSAPEESLSTVRQTTELLLPTVSSMDPSNMSEEQLAWLENSISLEFQNITREKWMSDMDQTFRHFIANIIQCNPDDIFYVSPTPMNKDGILYVTFIVVPKYEGSRRRRRQDDRDVVSSDLIMAELDLGALATQLGIPEDSITVYKGLPPVITLPTPEEIPINPEIVATTQEPPSVGETGGGKKGEQEGAFTILSSPGLFIAIIIVGSLSVVVITVGFIYLVCDRRRSTRGEYVTNSINKDLDLGIDNPAMLQDKTISNGNGAHLINIKVIDEQDIVPYDSFTQEEIMNCEVEDTHL